MNSSNTLHFQKGYVAGIKSATTEFFAPAVALARWLAWAARSRVRTEAAENRDSLMYASLEAIRRDLADIRAEQARNASAVCEVAESVSSVVERVKVVEMEMGRLTVAAESLRNFQATTPAPVRTPMAAPGSVTPGFELEVMRRSGVAEVAGSVWHSTGQARHAGRVHYPACSFAPTFDAAVLESAGELYFALQDEKDAPVRVFLRVD